MKPAQFWLLALLAPAAMGQTGPGIADAGPAGRGMSLRHTGPVFEMEFTNPALDPPHWVMTLYQDGSGHFRSDRVTADHGGADQENGPRETAGQDATGHETGAAKTAANAPILDRDIQVSAGFAASVFYFADTHNHFNINCEVRQKVAFEGWKRLSYSGPDGKGSCEYNFAKDAKVEEFGTSLLAVANTLNEEVRLERLLHHDPLGLDKEMEYLVGAANDGRVQQLGVIRSLLQHLADDENLLERVRKRAQMLLAKAGN